MKATFAFVSLLLSLALAQVITDGCTNFACNAVEESATICDSQQSTEQAYANCLCTDVFKINFNRCITGSVCAWNGTGNPADLLCTELFCVGKFPESFRPQTICNIDLTTNGTSGPTPTVPGITSSTASTTGTTPTTTYTGSSISTSSLTTTPSARVGTSTAVAASILSTSTTGRAPTLDISMGVIAGAVTGAIFAVTIAM